MPISAYRCTQCQQIFEQWRKENTIPHEAICPVCSGTCLLVTNERFPKRPHARREAIFYEKKNDNMFKELGQLSPCIVY